MDFSSNKVQNKVPVRHIYSDSIYQPHLRISSLSTAFSEDSHIHSRPNYTRASSYPLGSYTIYGGPPQAQQRHSVNGKISDGIDMDKRNRLTQNGHISDFIQPVPSRDNANISRSKSRTERTERKHHRLKQSRSLEQTKNAAIEQDESERESTGEKGKRHSSEKIRKSSSAKYQNKKLTTQSNQTQHIGNVHREETNLQYSYPMFKNGCDGKLDDDNNLNSQTENKKLKDKEKSSANNSLKSSKESSLSAKGSLDLKQKSYKSKLSSVDSEKKLKYSDRNSSASPETSSNELPNSKVRKSRSKRKEIQKSGGCIQPTFYGISGNDLSYPISTSVTNGKQKDKRCKNNLNLASTNFSVLETGDVINERRAGGSIFRRKNCCVLSLLCAVCLLLAGVVTTLIILFMTSSVPSDTNRFDMVRAHVRLRILNKEYNDNMRSHNHSSFMSVSEPFCKEVDYAFLTSSLHSEYFGCSTKEIRSGSIRLYYVTPFLDSPQVQNVTKIKNILSGKDNGRVTNKRLDNTAIYLGDFLMDANSIKIELESYKSESLPKRPKLIVKAQPTSVTQPSSKKRIINYSSTTSTPFSSSTRSVKSTATLRDFTESTVSRSTTAVKPTSKLEKSSVSTMSSPATLKAFTDSTLTAGVTPNPTTSTLPKATGTTQQSSQLPAMTTQDFSADMPSTTDYFEYFDDLESTTPLAARLPKIEMTSTEVYLKQRSGHLKCTVRGLKFYSGQISIYYQQTNDTEPKIIVMLVNDGQIYSTIFRDTPENLKISHKSKDYSVTIDLKFEEVTCFDTGLYKCELKSRGKEYTATGSLQGFAVPDKPTLSAPQSLIEGQELSKPITCTADVGYPPGTLRFEIKPRGHTHFFPLQEGTSLTSGPCQNNRTITLTYTPTKEANGTLLKCVVENKNIPHIHDVSSVIELQIIAGNICEGHGINKTLRHPFACNKYLLCLERHFEVHECDNGVCFDQDTGTCGQTSLTMAAVVAYLNEGVTSLKCRLTHTGTWSQITMFKAESSGERLKIVTAIRGQDPVIHNTSMKDRIFANVEIETRYEVELNVWVYVLTCADQGDYFCIVDAPFTVPGAKGYVDIRVKPSAPTLSVPNEIIEGLPTRYNFTCEADVGYPHGDLVFKMRLHNETDYKALSFVDEIIEEERNCSKVVKRTFQFIPSIVHNGMTVLCEVQNPITLPAGHSMVTSQTIHVVPGNFCHTHEDATPHVHPYDCHQYVQCSENYIYVQRCGNDHCFDPATLRCDAPDPNIKRSFDPNYPCRPNQNGVFFHHPFLCNKYIWCVQGEEIVQHCPIGTLYIDSGQCTFNADQSRCYKTENSKLLA